MRPYKSLSGKDSGVAYYAIADNYIDVFFTGDHHYRYTHKSAGKAVVDIMKALALAQEGLSTFISRNHPHYERKA